MTVVHSTAPLTAPDLPSAVAALRTRGLRVSSARRLVLESLYAAEGPASADRIAGGLDGRLPVSDLASVYRNLELLEELGLVHHVHLSHGPGLYAATGGPRREYLACERCGDHRAVDPAVLNAAREAIHLATGYAARFTHFPVVGVCPDCATPDHEEQVDARS